MSRIKKFGLGLGGVTVLFVALSAVVGSPPTSHHAQATAATRTAAPSTAVASTRIPGPKPKPSTAAPTPKPKPQLQPQPQMTAGQRQAIESAQNYLDMGGFSERGLINQLSSSAGEGFSRADATYAANHVHVDWNQQAVDSAKNYLNMGGFSRSGLIDQLTSSAGEGFTSAQANYAVNKVYR